MTISLRPITADVHIHTHHSHGTASTLSMYEAARAKGLTTVGFSEHSPRPEGYVYARDYQPKLISAYPEYVEEVKILKARGKGEGVAVLFGVELDYIPDHTDYAKKLCEEYPYDYILGGLHFQGTWGFDASQEDWDILSVAQCHEIYAAYYEDLARMCDTGLFHVAAHPDLIKIFSRERFDAWLALPGSQKLVRHALQVMQRNGVAMEVSSAGLRKPCKEIYPGRLIMQLARQANVSISFGSDAHCVNTPGYAFVELASYAARHGFSESVVFKGQKPISLPFNPPHAR